MQKIANKKGADKWKKVFEMINEVTERENLTFNDLKEIFSIGHELYKLKKGAMNNGRKVIKRYKSQMRSTG